MLPGGKPEAAGLGSLRVARLRFVHENDLELLNGIAAAAREEGFGFIDRLREEWREGVQRFDSEDEPLFGASLGGTLVGTAGMTRQGSALGRIRRVYVHPAYRPRGIAKTLMASVLAEARRHYPQVVLYTDTVEAARMYEELRFIPESPDGPDHATHRLIFPSGVRDAT